MNSRVERRPTNAPKTSVRKASHSHLGLAVATIAIVMPSYGAPAAVDPPSSSIPAPPGASNLIVDPNWRVLPPESELKLYYPERAYRMGISGEATATCTIGLNGNLVDCRLSSESPLREEFGHALLMMTKRLQIDTVTKSGLPSPGHAMKVRAHFTVSHTEAFAVQLVLLSA